MDIYLVYDQKWEDKDILYIGTDKTLADSIFNGGDHNRFLETWTDGKRINWTQGKYKRKA